LLAKRFFQAHLLASLLALGGALWFQYGQGLLPCPLCLWQRLPYAAAFLLSLLALSMASIQKSHLARWAMVPVYAASSGLAVYHSGIERHWWTGSTRCSSAATPTDLEALRTQILSTQPVRCDEIAWQLWGASLSNINALVSVSLLAFSLWGAFYLVRPLK
jgi:disulfide bond formation protein DsbB